MDLAKGRSWVPVICGLGAGVLATLSFTAFFFFTIIAAVYYYIRRNTVAGERRFLPSLFISAVVVRALLYFIIIGALTAKGRLLYYNTPHLKFPGFCAPYLLSEGAYYTLRSAAIASYWNGAWLSQNSLASLITNIYGFTWFLYLMSGCFFVFGYSPFSITLLNCIVGGAIPVVVYAIASALYGKRAAMIAAVITALFPSLLVWSIVNLKESVFILSFYLTLWGFSRYLLTKKKRFFIYSLGFMTMQLLIRYGYKAFIASSIGIFAIYFFLSYLWRLWVRKKALTIFILLVSLAVLAGIFRGQINSRVQDVLFRASTAQRGVESEGGFCYRLLSDEQLARSAMSPNDFMTMVVRGWFHLFLEPFPWRVIEKPKFILYLPQMLLWYVLLFFAFRGVRLSFYRHKRISLFLLIYFIIMASGLVVVSGNIGTVFRLRDVFSPLIFIFASGAIADRLYSKEAG